MGKKIQKALEFPCNQARILGTQLAAVGDQGVFDVTKLSGYRRPVATRVSGLEAPPRREEVNQFTRCEIDAAAFRTCPLDPYGPTLRSVGPVKQREELDVDRSSVRLGAPKKKLPVRHDADCVTDVNIQAVELSANPFELFS